MRVLVVTGRKAAGTVRSAVAGKADVLVMDIDVAAFVTPGRLEHSMPADHYDLIIIPGLITSDFSWLEKKLNIPIRLGPKHAVDLGPVLSIIDDIELSTTVAACELLTRRRRETALSDLLGIEETASGAFLLDGLKIGGDSVMKVMAEVVDATGLNASELEGRIRLFQASGADIIDLGVGMGATVHDVKKTVESARDAAAVPLSIDTVEPDLITAAVDVGVDMVLSLNSTNMMTAGPSIAEKDIAAVVIPDERGGLDSLAANMQAARDLGINKIIADPVLDPPGQDMLGSLVRYQQFKHAHPGIPVFFGVGNITELMDIDSVGINGMLASIAWEAGASILFTPEYSDKTRGSISELKTAAGMMALAGSRSSPPKDLGIDLLHLKEKRLRPFDELPEDFIAAQSSFQWTRDPAGSFKISISDCRSVDMKMVPGRIIARHTKYTLVGDCARDILDTALDLGLVSRLDHAGYLARELMKAELALKMGRSYSQDDEF